MMCGRLRFNAPLTALFIALLIASGLTLGVRASAADREFSGKWVLDTDAGDVASLEKVDANLAVSQGGGGIRCSTGTAEWAYALDGSETRKQIGEETRNSVVKWEGPALLVNTQVNGPRHYTVMDRWEMSRSGNTLTITRQVVSSNGEAEGRLVYRREGATVAPPAQASRQSDPASSGSPSLPTSPAPANPPHPTLPPAPRLPLPLLPPLT